jgi:hypothetical protein
MQGLKSGRRALIIDKLETTAISDLMGRRIRKIINTEILRNIKFKIEQKYDEMKSKWKM